MAREITVQFLRPRSIPPLSKRLPPLSRQWSHYYHYSHNSPTCKISAGLKQPIFRSVGRINQVTSLPCIPGFSVNEHNCSYQIPLSLLLCKISSALQGNVFQWFMN